MAFDVKRSVQSFPFAALHAIGIVESTCMDGADPQRDGMAISV
jgi:gamma-glutamyltranspeptidase / glutathione hydrolase